MIKIPYGISGFERIRKQGYKYIDKTKYIREIEEAFNAVIYTHLNEFVNRYKLNIQVKTV